MPTQGQNQAATRTFWVLTLLGVGLGLLGAVLLALEIVDFYNGEMEDPILGVTVWTSFICLGGFSIYTARVRYRGGFRTAVAGVLLVLGVVVLAALLEEYVTDQLEDTKETIISVCLYLFAGSGLAYSGYRRHLRIAAKGEVAVRREEEMESAEYPSILRRYLATVIDAVFILSVFVVVSALLQGTSEVVIWLRVGLTLALFLMYEPLCTSMFVTIGQWLMGIRVRSFRTRGRISLPAAYARIVVKLLLGVISFFSIPISQDRRGLHDLAVGSLVVYARAISERATHTCAPVLP